MNRSVNRLLLWYPRGWRDRYGEEFTELLVAEFAEHPRSFARALDIAATGLRARLAAVGLNGHPHDRAAAARASLGALAFCGAAFLMFAVAMWSQLATGLQWSIQDHSSQDHSGLNIAMALMSAGLLVFGVVAAGALCGLVRATIGAVARGEGRPLTRPALTALTGLIILFVGGRHFANAWPGTGGHLLWPVVHVPAWAAAFGWATTMWITSYVAHPGLLAAFPATQLAWMALSPVALGLVVTGVAGLASRLRHSAFAMRYAKWLFKVAVVGMILFLAGTLRWMASAGAGSPRGYHLGAIDFAGLAVLALALAVASHVIRTTRLTGAVER
ncbi:MAG TPA: hypothetical protein VFI65_00025 [Streptosporangiaceae bacterium]|nr:hypothetical protein [Streptosporangiaceae bacterium]